MKIVVYTQDQCSACHQAVEYLSRNQVAFTEKNITRDSVAREELIAKGFRATPVTMINDQPIIGFSVPQFRKALGLN
ncbi:MAG TPA: glutaredoxin family protein [Candidatus Binataceae bacterium]|nr:glutaredoxin family protein [Candidatus Binataceae bacterium]